MLLNVLNAGVTEPEPGSDQNLEAHSCMLGLTEEPQKKRSRSSAGKFINIIYELGVDKKKV